LVLTIFSIAGANSIDNESQIKQEVTQNEKIVIETDYITAYIFENEPDILYMDFESGCEIEMDYQTKKSIDNNDADCRGFYLSDDKKDIKEAL